LCVQEPLSKSRYREKLGNNFENDLGQICRIFDRKSLTGVKNLENIKNWPSLVVFYKYFVHKGVHFLCGKVGLRQVEHWVRSISSSSSASKTSSSNTHCNYQICGIMRELSFPSFLTRPFPGTGVHFFTFDVVEKA
jgi:hypothetical protein